MTGKPDSPPPEPAAETGLEQQNPAAPTEIANLRDEVDNTSG